MDDYAYKNLHKLPQFVSTLTSRKNSSTDLKPKDVKSSDFLSNLCSKRQRENKKPKVKTGDRVSISNYDLPFPKGYKSQVTQETLEFVAIFTGKPPTNTTKDDQDDNIRGKF